jgi:hypothetical protein
MIYKIERRRRRTGFLNSNIKHNEHNTLNDEEPKRPFEAFMSNYE